MELKAQEHKSTYVQKGGYQEIRISGCGYQDIRIPGKNKNELFLMP